MPTVGVSGDMGGTITIDGTEQQTVAETSAATFTPALDCQATLGVEIGVDITGTATLTFQVSTTGDFSGEELEFTETYDSGGNYLEQIGQAHQYVRAKVDQNLNRVEVVARGV